MIWQLVMRISVRCLCMCIHLYSLQNVFVLYVLRCHLWNIEREREREVNKKREREVNKKREKKGIHRRMEGSDE